jgi:DASH complex subunit ASK1
MMRRVGLPKNPDDWWQSSAASTSESSSLILDNKSFSTPSYYTTHAPAQSYAHKVVPEQRQTPISPALLSGVASFAAGGGPAASTEATPIDAAAPENDDTSSSTSTFSSSGEDDSVHNTAHPSAAFLLASRQRGRHDYDDDHDDEPDDGDDDFDDSLLDADAAAAARAPVHPFARARAQAAAHGDAGNYDEDSFDSFDGGGGPDEGEERLEETVFGVRPAEREAAQPRLRMFGEDLLQDTIGIGTQLARAGRIEESPTPWGGGAAGRSG